MSPWNPRKGLIGAVIDPLPLSVIRALWYGRMKLEIEQADIEAIANRVAEILRPMLACMANHDEKDALLDVAQLADYLNVSPSWIYDRIRDNEIPHAKLGKYLRFRRQEIDKWVETRSFKHFPALKIVKPNNRQTDCVSVK